MKPETPEKPMKVVVAMSGGVDSSVAAGLLVEAGHEVIGLAMRTHTLAAKSNRACCSPEDMHDARRVADLLGIRFYVLDYEETFLEEVVRPFAAAYSQGQTPNPCVTCNDRVKFRPLLRQANLLGADRLATGHYARIEQVGDMAYLHRGRDHDKDQAYFLYRLAQEQLRQIIFPVGHMDKATVRDHAARLGLPVADKLESQEICFVGPQGYAHTVEQVARAGQGAPLPEGDFVDAEGRVLGRHGGIHRFTLGQRRGLGISGPAPLYVIDIQADSHRVVLGPKEALLGPEVLLSNTFWTAAPPAVGDQVLLQRRHRGSPEPAVVQQLDGTGGAQLRLATPAPRAAPGQAVVVFDGERVLGGGTALAPKRAALRILAS